jgi:hypothetical protein
MTYTSKNQPLESSSGSNTTVPSRILISLALPLLVAVDVLCGEGRSVSAFSCVSSTRVRDITTKTRVQGRDIGGTLSRQRQLRASLLASAFFFSEEDDDHDNDDDDTEAAAHEWRDTRMMNGSWSNYNQFPSQSFPQPIPQDEVQVVDDRPPKTTPTFEVPSTLSVDGNGTGGLMKRSIGTGGANPALMVPSDVNPHMRMVTPIDSGKETKKLESSSPSTVVSFAALSALTQTTAKDDKEPSAQAQSTSSESDINGATNGNNQQFQQQHNQRQLIRFEGTSLMEESLHKTSDKTGNSFHPSAHNIKVKRFRGENSDEYRKGISKPKRHNLKQSLDHSHHINVDVTGTKGTSSNPQLESTGRQDPQQQAHLSVTRLVPFTGGSLMEEMIRGEPGKRSSMQTSKLVKFNGLSEMDRQRLLRHQEDSRSESNIFQHSNRKLVPYRKAPPKSETFDKSTNPSNKMVLFNKQASVASSVVRSQKREYYYVQYRPPTDATMARKTGLQANTPISLWNERDKFLDS